MGNTFSNAANRPLNFAAGSVPNVGGALKDWLQPMTFGSVTKKNVGFQVVETREPVNFQGVIQPFSARQLLLKPEGQRARSWFLLHSDISLELDVDDTITYKDKQYRVMAQNNFEDYGYMEYHLVGDWDGAGPRP